MKAEERARLSADVVDAAYCTMEDARPYAEAEIASALTLAQQEARAEREVEVAALREGLALVLSDVSVSPDGNSYARLTDTSYRRLRALLGGK